MKLLYLKSIDISINLEAIIEVHWNRHSRESDESETQTHIYLQGENTVIISDESDRALLRHNLRFFDIRSGAWEEDFDNEVAKLIAKIRVATDERIQQSDCYEAATELVKGLIMQEAEIKRVIEIVQQRQNEF